MKSQMLALFTIAACVFSSPLFAQSEAIKWNKVSNEDLAMTVYAPDTSAAAVVFGDMADLKFQVTPEEIQTVFQRHRRVKLLKQAGYEYADVSIDIHKPTEKLQNFKAQVILPNGERVALKRGDLFEEEPVEDYISYKFTFPQLQPGAIIEYQYDVSSNTYWQLPFWYYQEDIPVRYCSYRMEIPEWFEYVSLSQGTPKWKKYDVTTEERTVAFVGAYGGSEKVRVKIIEAVMADLPALRPEPYMTTMRDYIPQTRMQLNSIRWPNRPTDRILSSWPSVAETLWKHDDFGLQIKSKGQHGDITKDLAPVVANLTSPREKALALYKALSKRMQWNERYSIFARNKLNEVYARRTGSSGELNLLLLAVLRDFDIPAWPVLVSTRDHGAMTEIYPITSQFNHMFVACELDNGLLLLDLGNDMRPAGFVREAALNHMGWMVHPTEPRWIDFEAPVSKSTYLGKFKLAEDGGINGTFEAKYEGYSAVNGRMELRGEEGEDPLSQNLKEAHPNVSITKVEVEGKEEPDAPLKVKLSCTAPYGMAASERIYLSPLLLPLITERLETVEERKFPVDIPFASDERFVLQLELPEGYEIEEVPQPQRIQLQDNDAMFEYSVKTPQAALVYVDVRLRINRQFFPAEEYAHLKAFFDQAMDMQDLQVVLRKKL